MKCGKKISVLLVSWFMMTVCGSGIIPVQGAGPEAAGSSPQTLQKLEVQGKIAYLDAMGGYYVQGEKPHETYTIANQNSQVLGKLAKTGQRVTIEARPHGDLLFIETLDGQKYQGKQEPVFK